MMFNGPREGSIAWMTERLPEGTTLLKVDRWEVSIFINKDRILQDIEDVLDYLQGLEYYGIVYHYYIGTEVIR